MTGALPEQHEDQLQLGFQMIKNSYDRKVQQLEQERRVLLSSCEEQKNQASNLQRKNSAISSEIVEGQQRAQALSEENKELFKTVQQLRKQIQRLDLLKKNVMDSLAEDGNSLPGVEDSRNYMRDDYLRTSLPLTHAVNTGESHFNQSMPSAAMRAQTPPPSDWGQYGHNGGAAFGGGGAPAFASEPMAPPPPADEGIDGKQFFRQARASLTYEAFNEFLANIKRQNNQQQTREETLQEARRIFGPELHHLYAQFEQLLNKM